MSKLVNWPSNRPLMLLLMRPGNRLLLLTLLPLLSKLQSQSDLTMYGITFKKERYLRARRYSLVTRWHTMTSSFQSLLRALTRTLRSCD